MNAPLPPEKVAPNPFRLYVITDPALCPTDSILDKVEQALAGGTDWVQYRDKATDSHKEKFEICQTLKTLCDQYNSTLIINDDWQLAQQLGAGLHLGQDDLKQAATLVKKENFPILGISCHGQIDLAKNALELGADYVSFGACFLSKTKPKASLCSLSVIRQARETLSGDICAIGGISLNHVPLIIHSGANIVAACHTIWTAPDIQQHCMRYKQLLLSQTQKNDSFNYANHHREKVYDS